MGTRGRQRKLRIPSIPSRPDDDWAGYRDVLTGDQRGSHSTSYRIGQFAARKHLELFSAMPAVAGRSYAEVQEESIQKDRDFLASVARNVRRLEAALVTSDSNEIKARIDRLQAILRDPVPCSECPARAMCEVFQFSCDAFNRFVNPPHGRKSAYQPLHGMPSMDVGIAVFGPESREDLDVGSH